MIWHSGFQSRDYSMCVHAVPKHGDDRGGARGEAEARGLNAAEKIAAGLGDGWSSTTACWGFLYIPCVLIFLYSNLDFPGFHISGKKNKIVTAVQNLFRRLL